jgi:hypothetical protein
VNTQAANTIKFYEATTDIGVSEPYATISGEELTAAIKRFVSWAAMIATHPNLAQLIGDSSTTPILLATALRTAVQKSEHDGIFPNVVLPRQKFTSAMALIRASRQVAPEIRQLIAYESQKWEDDFPS